MNDTTIKAYNVIPHGESSERFYTPYLLDTAYLIFINNNPFIYDLNEPKEPLTIITYQRLVKILYQRLDTNHTGWGLVLYSYELQKSLKAIAHVDTYIEIDIPLDYLVSLGVISNSVHFIKD